MIEVAHLTKRYGDLAAVQDVSFSAVPGQILGFLGPNGAGKTTTMRVITGFLPATEGTVRVAGFDVFEQSAEVRKRIGYLPENPPLYNDMLVVPYLRFAAKLLWSMRPKPPFYLPGNSVVKLCPWLAGQKGKLAFLGLRSEKPIISFFNTSR